EGWGATGAWSRGSWVSRRNGEEDRTERTEATPGGRRGGSGRSAGSAWAFTGTLIFMRQRVPLLGYQAQPGPGESTCAGCRVAPICQQAYLPSTYSPPSPRFDGRTQAAAAHLA